MKRMKAYFYKAIVIIIILAVCPDGNGQNKKLQKTYHWKYEVNDDVKFIFNNYDCDLIIHSWDQPKIEYNMSIDASLHSEEDKERLAASIEDLEFTHSAGSVEINNRFWKSRKNIMGKKTIDLEGTKTIRYSEFKMKGELWIPISCNLTLKSKYSDIEMEDLKGGISLDLYNDKLYGGNMSGKTRIADKYSTLEFKNMMDIEADLYNTDIESVKIGNLTISSKYSDFKTGNAGKLEINAYNDKYAFGNTEDIKFTDKYSDLTTGISGNMEMDCYNSTVICNRAGDLELKSKYGKYEIGEAKNLNINSGYSDNYKIKSLKTLNITQTKYGTYKIDKLISSLLMDDGYSDKFTVLKTGPGYKGMKVNGKYVKIQVALDKEMNYRFKADVKYPKFDINEEAMDVKIKIKESSELKLEAIKGVEKEGMPEIVINGYDMAVTFTEGPER